MNESLLYKRLTTEQKEAVELALEMHRSVHKILAILKVAIPPKLDMQNRVLFDYLNVYGVAKFKKQVIDRKTEEKPEESAEPPKREMRVSKALPKLQLSEDETQQFRDKRQINRTVEDKKPRKTSVVLTSDSKESDEKSNTSQAAEVVENNKAEVRDTPSEVETFQADENGFLGTPTDTWDGKLERRDGMDRRRGSRRLNVDLVFKNKRFGKDRRSEGDRRKK